MASSSAPSSDPDIHEPTSEVETNDAARNYFGPMIETETQMFYPKLKSENPKLCQNSENKNLYILTWLCELY
ncbi:hypothetical protein F8M41_007097 [Gigaspora margarita]|uniref:Uncharacterized protein n=1 Tax=Gigaspora margarita TaxID=4874 RepID=A0A8H4A4T0_GIGMA|nr:hypothetical protein F8M41_007097 [Gigaspora margarita]